MRILAVATVIGLLVTPTGPRHRGRSLRRALQKLPLQGLLRGKRARHRPQSVGRRKSWQRLASAEWTGLAEASAAAVESGLRRPEAAHEKSETAFST
jgi:hypothetical protein